MFSAQTSWSDQRSTWPMRFREMWPRLRLGTRIAATILVALISVHALYAVLFFLMPARIITTYSAQWLAGKGSKS